LDPSAIIDELCRRYGVSPKFGNRLRPLIERAQVVPAESSARIMDLVERSFAEEARRAREEESEKRANAQRERRMLSAVAAILHGWDPPEWLRGWSERSSPTEDENERG
jgi:hypothetical protein